ncbi:MULTISPECIES: M3 family oligoendopeptidase [unclassified Oceanobacillus]|uniref:M3 family oligoendopeptidase n=1 Tax=unclassified Oceanobacillus TaxID=2630292 RepID=UPI001BE643C5|nr:MULTISPECIES: M3 family oligoendopeptidase [unclassified Oceanobacillus]MBT2600213.1 M3 family oligoendopeptidase [Oceanobacillus sp. ISL-74]MBT2650371.1 M3 family oligoendopeptidase [Oceanobacillus sp. ISL-73]
MLTFKDYIYERPDIEKSKDKFHQLVDVFKSAPDMKQAKKAIDEINQLRNNLYTMYNLVYIRASIDTKDEYYQQERDHFDFIEPEIQEMVTSFYKALFESPFEKDLRKEYGSQLFDLAACEVKAFSKEIIPLLQQENKLSSEYSKLIASADIEFKGKTYTLAQLGPFAQHKDRSVRKDAMKAAQSFFVENEEALDRIYDDLVKVRHEIAQKLGYDNFIEVGYLRMQRVDYNANMVEVFRQQVRDVIVPIATKLYKKQAKRIGVDKLKAYDESFVFPSGNATPKGSPEWIIENGKKMYQELSTETGEFFQFMLDHELMDLEAKKGKEAGGYCTFIEDYSSPYIFANFNGTSDDIDVLTHEAGHAFQVYSSRNYSVPEYYFPTSESAEIHSMSMEFFTYPWMKEFFGDEVEKYKYAHLSDALQFIPYGVAVDEFQHLVYENPEWTPIERKQAWKKLEEIYLPHRDYDGIPNLEAGGFWQKQGHIYEDPFYYIDYTLAQICAFQFWKKAQEDNESAWEDYVKLCKLGGSKPFLQLLKEGNLQSPFEEGTVASVVKIIKDYLESIDDNSL